MNKKPIWLKGEHCITFLMGIMLPNQTYCFTNDSVYFLDFKGLVLKAIIPTFNCKISSNSHTRLNYLSLYFANHLNKDL